MRKVWIAVVGAALLGACTGDRPTEPTPLIESSGVATFDLTETGNGPGACLQEDVDDANAIKTGFVPGEGDLNCTSNDVDISIAEVSEYSFVSDAGPWTPLAEGEVIECTGGETVYVNTSALVENNAQERYDLGMWINPIDGGSALTGGECLQFNLIPGENGSESLEADNPDSCGDVAAGELLTIPLDVLTIECEDPDEDGFVEIGACAAWQNSEDGADRICPNTTLFGANDYRYGTLPENKSKCRCEPLLLPISVKGKIRVDKVTLPSGDPTSFTFTPTDFNGGSTFNLTDAAAPFESELLDAGTYSVVETVPAGWQLTARACVFTGTSDPADFSLISNGVEIDLGPGDDVTCTFTNTASATIDVEKQTIGGTATFNYTTVGTGLAGFSRNTGTANPTTTAPISLSGANVAGDKYITESALAGWTLTDIQCTASGATVEIGTGTGAGFSNNGSALFDQGDNTVKITLTAGSAPSCLFVNTRSSSLDIEKQSIGGTETFDYTVNGTGLSPFTRNTGSANPTASAPFEFTGLQLGDKYVTESAETGWTLTDIQCTENGATILIGTGQGGAFNQGTSAGFDEGDNTVKATVGAGQTPSCLFINTKNASLAIQKHSLGGTAIFDYTVNGSGLSPFTRNTGTANPTAEAAFPFTGFQLGDKYVTETAEAGYALTDITCTANGADIFIGTGQGGAFSQGTSAGFDEGDNTVKAVIGAGDTPTCTFENTKYGSITIAKETDPDAATGSFGFTRDFGGAFSLEDGDDETFSDLLPGTYVVTEDDPTPLFDLYDIQCSGDTDSDITTSVNDRDVEIDLAAGEDITCTFYNRQRATVTVYKTEGGGLPLTRAWEFEIRKNATTLSSGTVVATGTAVLATGLVEFACSPNPNTYCENDGGIAYIVPGDYQFCEINMPAGWSNNISGFTPNGETPEGGDNGNECINITLGAGDSGMPSGITTGDVAIDNTPPPGGDARTIGYWKTHSCMAPGNQEDALSDNLPILLTSDGAGGGWLINTCSTVVYLLDKREIVGQHKKMANDAAYGLAAQLAAALLNVNAGAGTCSAVTTAIQDAQELLYDIGFDGSGQFLGPKSTNPLRAEALDLAGTLDDYNNNELCPAP